MREEYKLRTRDFYPVVGLFNYINRAKSGCYSLKSNLSSKNDWKEYAHFVLRERALFLYNLGLAGGVLVGLEKILNN